MKYIAKSHNEKSGEYDCRWALTIDLRNDGWTDMRIKGVSMEMMSNRTE
jgi:hypothetical protein